MKGSRITSYLFVIVVLSLLAFTMSPHVAGARAATARGVLAPPVSSNAHPKPDVPVYFSELPLCTSRGFPEDITTGPDGNLWITEPFGNEVGRITLKGIINLYPLPNSNSHPEGIIAGRDGNLWFTETSGNRIGLINPSTGAITEYIIPTPNSNPYGIIAGPDGNLWFTEIGANKIGRINPKTGQFKEYAIPTAGSYPEYITVGSDKNLWFGEFLGNKIGRITLKGKITEFPVPTPNSRPGIPTAGPDGNVWFTENTGNKIGRITPKGKIKEFTVPTANSGPNGITKGPDGNLWFAETNGNNIGQITPKGMITEYAIPIPNSQPDVITVGPDGNLWFTGTNPYQLVRLSTQPIPPTWRLVCSPNVGSVDNHLHAVTALSATNMWAVGYYTDSNSNELTLIEHWDGTQWSVVPSPNAGMSINRLFGVVGTSPTDVWATGDYYNASLAAFQTLIEHWDGSAWSIIPSPNGSTLRNGLRNVVALSPTNAWTTGSYDTPGGPMQTLVEHWNGSQWSIMSSLSPGSQVNELYNVMALSPSNIWAVGDTSNTGNPIQTLIEHFDGNSWSVIPSADASPYFNAFRGVAGVSASDIWASGFYQDASGNQYTLTEHWDGTSWSIVASANPGAVSNTLDRIVAIASGDVWLVGDYINGSGNDQTLAEHWDGTSWSVVPPVNPDSADILNGVTATASDNVWAVGQYVNSSGIGQTLIEQWA